MPMTAKRLLLATIVLLLVSSSVVAHDVSESNADFYVRPTGIDVELHMALSSAALLLSTPDQAVSISIDTYDNYSARLQAVAPSLLTLTGGDGTTLKPDATAVTMTEEYDVLFTLHYPLPVPMPGNLRIHPDYLARMIASHVGTFYVVDGFGGTFGWAQMAPDSQDLDVRLPAVTDLGRARPAASIAATQTVAQSPGGVRWLPWAISGGALVLVLLAVRVFARGNKAKGTSC